MDDTETSPAELPTIAPILLYLLIPISRFPHISCVSDMIRKEFGFEFVPYNQIGLNFVHVSDLGLFGSKDHSELAKTVKMSGWNDGGRLGVGVNIRESSELL